MCIETSNSWEFEGFSLALGIPITNAVANSFLILLICNLYFGLTLSRRCLAIGSFLRGSNSSRGEKQKQGGDDLHATHTPDGMKALQAFTTIIEPRPHVSQSLFAREVDHHALLCETASARCSRTIPSNPRCGNRNARCASPTDAITATDGSKACGALGTHHW